MVDQYIFKNLRSGTAYRFKLRMVDNATNSTYFTNWTEVKPLATLVPKAWSSHEFSILQVRGTGLNNFNSSFIKIDDNVLMDSAFYIGLYLSVIDRRNLSQVFSGIYNTTIPGTSDFQYATEMGDKIKSYNSNYFIVVASSYGWEPFFSQYLGRVLQNCGAMQIMEFTNYFSAQFNNKTTYNDWFSDKMFPPHNLYHPYVFVGIPGLSPGMGFEVMRPNQGFYKSLANQPYAELRIILRFSSLLGMYTFDSQHQIHQGNQYKHTYNDIFKNVDYSLRRTLPQIMQADLASKYDYRTSIYVPLMDLVIYSNSSAGNNTESEKVFLQPGKYKVRYDYKLGFTGKNNGASTDVFAPNFVAYEDQPYYAWVQNQMYQEDDRMCQPPYNSSFFFKFTNGQRGQLSDNKNCLLFQNAWATLLNNGTTYTIYNSTGGLKDYSYFEAKLPEILKCYTGVVQNYCPYLTNDVKAQFSGYPGAIV